jgi:hypothetical protein
MDTSTPKIRIELTEQQRQQIRDIAGTDVEAIEFDVVELEQRIAPSLFSACTKGSHYPTATIIV